MPKLRLQPKQSRLYDAVESGTATWIGMGGGRGAAKSAGIDRIALARRMSLKGTVGCIVMRNYDQVRKYHIEPMLRAYPDLEPYLAKSDSKLKIPVGGGQYSEIDFSYAENLSDVERRFRSANYYDIFVDQAEQFIEPELREMKQANRWAGAKQGACKMVLAFNMGGAGIQTLRKWFHSKEYNALERPEDFDFIHVFPWDNVEWVRAALEQDGLTELDYYGWPEERRMAYAAERGDYTKNLNSQDESLRARDWFGSWESLEGAFFGRVFDRESTIVTPQQVKALIKPWNPRWLAEDWGKAHYCASYWSARVELPPSEALAVLGWTTDKPLRAVVTYREHVTNEKASSDLARELVEKTPADERKQVERFYLSPDAFGERDSQNTIAINQGRVMREYGMPYPAEADNERQGGWLLMYNMLLESKRHGAMGGDVWLISSECPELLNAIPVLMRDPKNLDDVLKTDKGNARIEQDAGDAARYALKSFLSPGVKPKAVELAERLAPIQDNTAKHIAHLQFDQQYKNRLRAFKVR
jgi:hypothetical protein